MTEEERAIARSTALFAESPAAEAAAPR
jgi:hypothetical protein